MSRLGLFFHILFSHKWHLTDLLLVLTWEPHTPVLVTGSMTESKLLQMTRGNRTTPSYVAFTDSERLIGDAAKNQGRHETLTTQSLMLSV